MLTYASKHLIAPGDILHCNSNSFLSKTIQLFCRSRINHSAMVIEIHNTLYIIESDQNGVNVKLLETWLNKANYNFYISRPDPDVFSIDQITSRALSRVGYTPYDFAALFFHQIHYQFTGKWKGKKGNSAADKMYCSEFIAWVFNLPLFYLNSPQDLFNYTLSSQAFKNIN